ncbi:MAG: helix-turn-helix transcriptional regulator [Anaerobutyricum soehngenii]
MDKKLIAKRLIELRGEKTQFEVAKEVGISLSALAMYETGNRTPRDEIKIKLAKYYGITVESLFFSPDMSRNVSNSN